MPRRTSMDGEGGVVHLLFLVPDRQKDAPMNLATAAVGGAFHGDGFCHTELCIPHPIGHGYQSCSIYQGECVSVTQSKTFANPGYVVHSIAVSAAELRRIRAFVAEQVKDQTPFDLWGMYLALLPFPIRCPSDARGTFCSKLVVEALQAGGIECVQGHNPNLVSPSKLYKILCKDTREGRRVVGSVDYKQKQMSSAGFGTKGGYQRLQG